MVALGRCVGLACWKGGGFGFVLQVVQAPTSDRPIHLPATAVPLPLHSKFDCTSGLPLPRLPLIVGISRSSSHAHNTAHIKRHCPFVLLRGRRRARFWLPRASRPVPSRWPLHLASHSPAGCRCSLAMATPKKDPLDVLQLMVNDVVSLCLLRSPLLMDSCLTRLSSSYKLERRFVCPVKMQRGTQFNFKALSSQSCRTPCGTFTTR